ncbi:MAG TPA: serine hydrolase, partial [Verrucomicrobiae bacterium]|nr:serine hydrolase [Verrucomicrobiae bacterium]
MDAAIEQTIKEKSIPGGVLWLEHNGVAYHEAYGKRALIPAEEPMTEETIFDIASLTKVVATTPAMMLLIERGKVRLEDRVQKFIPEFKGSGKENITIRHLMTHTSGFPSGLGRAIPWSGYDTAIRKACQERLENPPGTHFRYSDINFIVLGDVVKRVSGKPLNEFAEQEIYRPLLMRDTRFLPPPAWRPSIAPTEKVDDRVLRGVVHDPTSQLMGGVAGHAGLFTTASDLARYARMILNGGELEGTRIFKPGTVKLMASVQSPDEVPSRRGLGWDIDSAYSRPRGKWFPLGSFGHTGFTGTSLWIDPFSRTFWIFLSNRVHPSRSGNVLPLQARLADLCAEAVRDFDFNNVPGELPFRPGTEGPATTIRAKTSGALNGIDVLSKSQFALLKGLRVGLVTNHTGRDRNGTQTIDLLARAPDVKLKVLFSPEHGIRGALDEKVADSVDQKTGLPVYSLYGTRRIPAP